MGDAAPVPEPLPAAGDSAAPPVLPGPESTPFDPTAPGAAPLPTIDERVGDLEGKVGGLEESLSTTNAVVDRLNKIKLSGYIQGRFEWRGDSTDSIDAGGTSQVKTQFLVRRGRLKALYEGRNAEYMLQIDAVGSGVTLKDAEATLVDTWTPFGLRLTMGQFKWPFGYEVLQSSGDREMPERSLVIRTLFPGERDRGLRLTARHEWLRLAAALVNGNGTQGPTDQNSFKDIVARVGGDLGPVVGGLSGYWGRRLAATPAKAVGLTWTDANMDKVVTPDEITFSASAPTSYRRFSILRLGADLQTYLDVPGLGGLALKGEFIYARDRNLSFGTVAADKCQDRTQLGWIVTAVQNVGDYAGVVARVDSFDRNFTCALDSTCTAAIASAPVL